MCPRSTLRADKLLNFKLSKGSMAMKRQSAIHFLHFPTFQTGSAKGNDATNDLALSYTP